MHFSIWWSRKHQQIKPSFINSEMSSQIFLFSNFDYFYYLSLIVYHQFILLSLEKKKWILNQMKTFRKNVDKLEWIYNHCMNINDSDCWEVMLLHCLPTVNCLFNRPICTSITVSITGFMCWLISRKFLGTSGLYTLFEYFIQLIIHLKKHFGVKTYFWNPISIFLFILFDENEELQFIGWLWAKHHVSYFIYLLALTFDIVGWPDF